MSEAETSVEPGLCQCGCGERTGVWAATDRVRGRVRGQHKAFVQGHNGRGKGHLKARPVEERFWEKVSRGKRSECWAWQGQQNRAGYGQFRVGEKTRLAHRVSYELEFGEIPSGRGFHGTCVCHHCDNPSCVNPSHLFLGTHAENMADLSAKKRRSGSKNPQATLNEDAVRDIRARLSDGEKAVDVARLFGVDPGTVGKIKRGESWVHV